MSAIICITKVEYTFEDYFGYDAGDEDDDDDDGAMKSSIDIDVNNMGHAECDQMTVYVFVYVK